MDSGLVVATANSKRKCRKERRDVLCGTGLDPSTTGPSPIHRSTYFISTGLGGSGLKNKGLGPDLRSPRTAYTRHIVISFLKLFDIFLNVLFCTDRGRAYTTVRIE